MAKPNWITLKPTSGTGTGKSTVTVPVYSGRINREGVITALAENGGTDTATVVQTGVEFITVYTTSYELANTGGTVLIQGTSNCANLKVKEDTSRIEGVTYTIEVNEVPDESWNGNSDTQIDGDPGASQKFTFKITATIAANKTEKSRIHAITMQNGNTTVSSDKLTITQAAGVKTYANPVINTFTYSEIPAKGGRTQPTITYSQSWGWNGSTTGGGTITTGGTFAYTGDLVDPMNGMVDADSLGTTEKVRTKLTTVSATVTLNGKKSVEKTADVYQAANVATYGDVTIVGGTVADVPASGGTVANVLGVSGNQTVTYTSEETKRGSVEIYVTSEGVTGSNLGTTVKSRTKLGVLTVKAIGEGEETATKDFDVYQAANTATYGEVVLTFTTPVNIQASGSTYSLADQLSTKANQNVTFTSGASRKGNITATYTEKSPLEGFSLDTESGIVTITENVEISARNGYVVTINATGEGTKSASTDVTFNQQGGESTVSITPETLEFEATGGSQEITITSNDSWTLK